MITGRSEARMANRIYRLQEADAVRIANPESASSVRPSRPSRPSHSLPTLEELRLRLEGLRQRNQHLAPIQNPPEYTL